MKFQNYSKWKYNNSSKIVDQKWLDMKNLEKYASGMAPHKFSFALDSLPSLVSGHTRTAYGSVIPNIR